MNIALSILVALLLFPGHATVTVACHNWWYGRLVGRRMTDVVQLAHLFWLFTLTAYLCPSLWAVLPMGETVGPIQIGLACIGWVLLVAVTIARRFHQRPQEVSDYARTRISPVLRPGRLDHGGGWRGRVAKWPGNEVLYPSLTTSVVQLPDLPPSWDGLKVLHISDLHFRETPTREWFRAVIFECSRLHPDLVLLTGDTVDGLAYHQWVGGTLGRFPEKTVRVGILGNHDMWYKPDMLEKALRRHRYHMVGGREKIIRIKGVDTRFIGNERPWRGRHTSGAGLGSADFTIALCHSPDQAAWAAQAGAKLIFAGHVHGGQIRLPLIGPVIMPSRHGRRFDHGWFRVGKSLLHVTCGLGSSQPLRWGCPPEVALIILKANQQ
ncbi:MAG: hypothetical protein FJ261_02280 [Planctomycetes bacterium]|nr:hypothetical protein [Planctomycetota bacterium]